jgi:hypothetical protein
VLTPPIDVSDDRDSDENPARRLPAWNLADTVSNAKFVSGLERPRPRMEPS